MCKSLTKSLICSEWVKLLNKYWTLYVLLKSNKEQLTLVYILPPIFGVSKSDINIQGLFHGKSCIL